MKKKKGIIIGIIIALILLVVAFVLYKGGFIMSEGSSADKVYVEKVSSIMGQGANTSNVYMGVVESQDTKDINKSVEREVDKILVEVGQEINVGDELFSYKTADLYTDIKQFGFDIEEIDLQIADYNRQINSLKETLAKTEGENEKKDLNNQIDALTTQIAIAENNKSGIRTKISDSQKKIEDSVVKSTVGGTILSINPEGYDANGNAVAFIQVRSSGDVRVKGKINEQNVWSISEGMEVTLRSRVDSSQTWKGTISKIVTDTTENDNNNYYGGDSSASSSKYPFYIDLLDNTGLMMGQHLYIELDQDENTAIDMSKGTYIYNWYVTTDEAGNNYIWVADKNMRLEKRLITIEETLDDGQIYRLAEGCLTNDDYICYPVEYLYEGVTCVTSQEEVDQTSPMYQNYYDSLGEGDMSEGEYTEDSIYEDENVETEDTGIATENMETEDTEDQSSEKEEATE